MERPIIFNTDTVQAVLDGRKTQARKPIKPQPEWDAAREQWMFRRGKGRYTLSDFIQHCPYGRPGDRLWVRETWRVSSESNNYANGCKKLWVEYRAGWRRGFKQQIDTFPVDSDVAVKAWGRHKSGTWRPSIHMPRWASRITLEITDVRAGLVQDITPEDAIAEGIRLTRLTFAECTVSHWEDYPTPNIGNEDPRTAFAVLWDSIYAKRGLGWDVNPWVWVIDFKVVQRQRPER